MAESGIGSISQDVLTKIRLAFGVDETLLWQVTPMEIILGESLLTPGLQTAVRVHSYFHNLPIKDLDGYKGAPINISLERPILEQFGITPTMNIAQTVYRIDNRKLINNVTEEFIIHACDKTLLIDGATLVSKFWKCTQPSAVVSDVLSSCAGATQLDIEEACCARDYMAENIHPFQVVEQQANVALAGGNDPSFIHYMTYIRGGTHHFRSLYSLTKQSPIISYYYDETGVVSGYANPRGIMTHSFPCDFDLLSDVLNGLNVGGGGSSAALFNPLIKKFSLYGAQQQGCGLGAGQHKTGMTNLGSEGQQNACPDYAYLFTQKRQARMGLLEQDKIALRVTVPWNPELHAGKIINLKLYNKEDITGIALNYGSGDYLISSMTHNIKNGGFSTTTLDAVSETVGHGEV